MSSGTEHCTDHKGNRDSLHQYITETADTKGYDGVTSRDYVHQCQMRRPITLITVIAGTLLISMSSETAQP